MGCCLGRTRIAPAILVALGVLSAAAVASAAPAPPIDLQVAGGADSWHPENRFRLDWTNPQADPPVAAVHYRIRNSLGAVVAGERIPGAVRVADNLFISAIPGVYDAEVWLEDAVGSQGTAATAKLRFDNARPGDAYPIEVDGWLGRAAFPHTVHISHPSGEPPLSGIRGYAVSVDAQSNGNPCAAVDRCTDAETDLHGGVNDDSLSIVALPEGTSHVHAVAVSGSGMKSAAAGHATLRVDTTDPLTTLTGAPAGWSDQPLTLIATAADTGSGMSPRGEASPFTAIEVDGGVPRVRSGAYVSATVIANGLHEVAYYARDAAGNVNDGQTSNGKENPPPSTVTVGIDREAPEIGFANSPPPGDPELVRVRVRDPLSGPDLSRGWIGVRPAGSGDRFEPLPPEEPSSDSLQARWDSDAYPPGDYEFQATAYDRAGNSAVTTRRANGTTMVLPTPLKTPTALRVRFGPPGDAGPRCLRRGAFRRCRRGRAGSSGWGPQGRLLAFGRSIRLRGRLIAGIGTPLQGMGVRIVERFPAGSGLVERESRVETRAGGDFAIRLRAGPSRTVIATFGGTPSLSRSASLPLHLGVRSGVGLRVSSSVARIGGRPVIFRGRIAKGRDGGPLRGRSVQLQFRLPGLPWSEFRTLRADGRGRFRYAYRFSDDDSRGARFQFRAYLPAQRDWPYEPAGSRPVTVRGR